jgi:hypothetical protein
MARHAARPEVGAVPADPARLWQRFQRQLALSLGALASPRLNPAEAGTTERVLVRSATVVGVPDGFAILSMRTRGSTVNRGQLSRADA